MIDVTSPQPPVEVLAQMKIAHLGMIQGVIARMSGFSANAKNFCITILAALVAVAFQKPIPALVWAGLAVPLLFAVLDAYYLAQEKRFRDLYNDVCARELENCADLRIVPGTLGFRKIAKASLSPSIVGIYLALMLGTSFLLYVAGHAQPTVAASDGVAPGLPVAGKETTASAGPAQRLRACEPTHAAEKLSVASGRRHTVC